LRNYKILRIAGVHYQSVIKDFVKKNPNFISLSYSEMLKMIFNSSIVYSDAFSNSFSKIGQKSYEIIADFEIIQKKWAVENNLFFQEKNWMKDILISQIKKIKPDVIYLQGTEWSIPGKLFKKRQNENLITILKQKFPFIKKIIVYSGFPSPANRIIGADIFFSSPPSILNYYKKLGLNPKLLYHAFDENLISKLTPVNHKYNFTFSGSSRAPESRYWYLKKLMESTDLELWLNESSNKKNVDSYSLKNFARGGVKRIFEPLSSDQLGKLISLDFIPKKLRGVIAQKSKEKKLIESGSEKPLGSLFKDRCNSPLIGLDMYNLLSSSRITFNKHTDKAWGCVGNMRMFEATGVGTCLLSDTGKNINDLFEEDKEIVTYTSVEEAIEKVKYLENNPKKAIEIAQAGQKRTLKDHTVLNRCKQIDEVLQKEL